MSLDANKLPKRSSAKDKETMAEFIRDKITRNANGTVSYNGTWSDLLVGQALNYPTRSVAALRRNRFGDLHVEQKKVAILDGKADKKSNLETRVVLLETLVARQQADIAALLDQRTRP